MPQFETRIRAFALVAAMLLTCAIGASVALGQSTGGTSHDAQADAMSQKHSPATIARIQRKLGVRPVSGVYGPLTRAAVRRFQKRRGLAVDGLLGPKTLRALGLRRPRSDSGTETAVRVPAALRRIAQCESGGNPRAVSADGRYRGKYQFDLATWRSLGGKGDPADAPEAEQDRLAVKLYRQRGTAPWANCAS